MPTTFSSSSTPVYLDRFHSPPLSAEWAWATLRAEARMSATVCSAALVMFEVGALTTMTPALVAASHVDVVEADARTGHHAQLRRGGHGLGVDLGGAAHDQGVHVGESRKERGPVGAVDLTDLEVRSEDGETGLGELLCDQYDGLVHW